MLHPTEKLRSKRLEGVAMGVKGDVSDMSPPTATVP